MLTHPPFTGLWSASQCNKMSINSTLPLRMPLPIFIAIINKKFFFYIKSHKEWDKSAWICLMAFSTSILTWVGELRFAFTWTTNVLRIWTVGATCPHTTTCLNSLSNSALSRLIRLSSIRIQSLWLFTIWLYNFNLMIFRTRKSLKRPLRTLKIFKKSMNLRF